MFQHVFTAFSKPQIIQNRIITSDKTQTLSNQYIPTFTKKEWSSLITNNENKYNFVLNLYHKNKKYLKLLKSELSE